MTHDDASNSLERFRRRAVQDSFFLGHALGRFASERGLGDEELAKFLGCAVDRLPQLMACRSPNPKDQKFAADVRMIAEFVRCKEDRLLLALRELSVLGALRAVPGATKDAPVQSDLLAARQHRDKSQGHTKYGHNDDRPRGT